MSSSTVPKISLVADRECDRKDAFVRTAADDAALRRAPAVRALLLYLWDRRDEAVNEFRIATECLGKKSDFDPKLDATVRVHLSRLRQKLKEFNDGAGDGAAYRLSVPQGSYRVEVTPAAEVASGAAATELMTPPSRPWLWIAVTFALALCCMGLAIWNRQLAARVAVPEALPRFWSAFFANGKPSTLVLPTPVFFEWPENMLKVRDTRINDFDDYRKPGPLAELVGRYGPPKLMQNYTVVSDTFAAVKLAQYLQGRGVPNSFSGTTDFSIEQFGARNVVLIGLSSTSLHIRRLMEKTSFYSNPAEASTVLDRRPEAGQPGQYKMIQQSGSRRSVHGVVAVLPGGPSGGRILMLAGWATAALVTSLVDPASLDKLDELWRGAGSPEYFEVLVQAEIDGNAVLRASPVMVRVFGGGRG